MKVLLVDDDLIHLTILRKIFENSEDEVVLARNGKEALWQVEFDPRFHVIVTDILMPEMDGIELLDHLKEKEETRNIPVIGITSGDVEAVKLQSLNSFDQLVPKPMDFFDLYTLAKARASA